MRSKSRRARTPVTLAGIGHTLSVRWPPDLEKGRSRLTDQPDCCSSEVQRLSSVAWKVPPVQIASPTPRSRNASTSSRTMRCSSQASPSPFPHSPVSPCASNPLHRRLRPTRRAGENTHLPPPGRRDRRFRPRTTPLKSESESTLMTMKMRMRRDPTRSCRRLPPPDPADVTSVSGSRRHRSRAPSLRLDHLR